MQIAVRVCERVHSRWARQVRGHRSPDLLRKQKRPRHRRIQRPVRARRARPPGNTSGTSKMREREPWRASRDKSSDSPARVRPPAKQKAESANQRALGLQQAVGNQEVMRLLQSNAIQAKLHVSQPGDPDEIEADRVADQVVSAAPPATVHRKCSCPGGTASCPACEEEEVEKAKGIHRKANQPSNQGLSVRDDFVQSLGAGQPLEPEVSKSMESRLGADFKDVRVHTDSRAATSARSINAQAFTSGENVVFGSAEYAPHTSAGRKLLAHE